AAVEDRSGVVTEPPQQPPQPAREHPVVLVVRDDLTSVGDAEPPEGFGQPCGIRQRMPAVPARLDAREIAIEMRVARTRDMRPEICRLSPRGIVELEPAIDDDE